MQNTCLRTSAPNDGDVAQLGEHHVRNVGVVGSNPIISTIEIPTGQAIAWPVLFCMTKGFEPVRSIRVKKQPSGLFLANREEALADEAKRAKRDSESHHQFQRPFVRTAFLFAAAQASRGAFRLQPSARVPKYASPRLRPNRTRERPCSLSLFDLCFLTGPCCLA